MAEHPSSPSTTERMVAGARLPEDADATMRPKVLGDFIGQAAVRENLSVFIAAARSRKEPLDQ